MRAGVLPALILFDGFKKFHKVTSKIDLLNATISFASMENFCQSPIARDSNLCQATLTHTHIHTVNTTNFITQIKCFAFDLAQFPYYSYAPLDRLETLDDHLNRGLITVQQQQTRHSFYCCIHCQGVPRPLSPSPSQSYLCFYAYLPAICAANK